MSEAKPIEFKAQLVSGETKIFAADQWPITTEIKPAELESLPAGLVVIDGDTMTITVANGVAQYLRTSTAEDGTETFEFVEGQFDPALEQAKQPNADLGDASAKVPHEGTLTAEEEDPEDLVIDTTADQGHREYVQRPRRTFGDVLSAETRAAFARGDMSAHASIHNFEIAAGDFKRAAQQLVKTLTEDSELAETIGYIIADL